MTLRTIGYWISFTSLVLGGMGCEPRVEPGGDADPGIFESDVPEAGRSGISRSSSGGMERTSAASGVTPSTPVDGGAAVRAIEEADIIKLEGSRLYALSQYGGLSIVDVSTRDRMRLLGRAKLQAQPFELYVRDQIVFALYNGYGEYVADETTGDRRWVTTSHVVAFDTSNPSSPAVIGRFAVPGTIQDSRIVGNVLYVVGFESNSCWRCAEGQHTTIVSLDVSQPSAIRKVDERAYVEDTTLSYSWKRSISVNDQRMYIAGPQYGSAGPEGSVIQVVDISDPSGRLVDGASVSAAGKIDSRWQMDETNGILRIISQPGDWRPVESPRIQTFSVESSLALTKLANVEMVVPLNEMLRSVRFDGPRAYAITAVQTDPLLTIDLSDPAQPRQAGELVMPGWIYHMEPRGERLVALGYDQGNAAGALAVSLFDVSDLAKPTMLDRVNFGGDWASMTEDQDRIHKAFQVLDATNLVLMPFSGYTYDEVNCSSKFQSGVQLIDWANDKLGLQGIAGTVGEARRGFLHNDRLFTVSEERVETFDIADRGAPEQTDSLKLAQNVVRTLDAGTAVVKIGQDWYTGSISIDTTTVADVESPTSNGHVDVNISQLGCNAGSNLAQI
ncbi:MAG TPA: beta-propeller domain-containing protein, partial [Polyangiaceae bacterium]|nr:beta-propeller domain-containing protein [Polyangiaceae bacterium]